MNSWEHVSKIITADALEDLGGHKKLQSPEGQAFVKQLQQMYDERAAPFYPWLAREFRRGRLIHHPGPYARDWVNNPLPQDFPHSQGSVDEMPAGLLYGHPRSLHPDRLHIGDLRHWADWYHSPTRRKVPLDQLKVSDMPGEIQRWEEDMARKAKAAELMPHRTEGEVVHRFPDDWTIRKLPSSALPFEGWAMRGKPTASHPDGLPICVGDGPYDEPVDKGHKHIYSLRDPDHMPHATMELTPDRRGDPKYPGFDFDQAREAQLSHPNPHKRWPEAVFDKLRAYAANPDWSQLEDTPIDVPGWHDPEYTHTMTHGQVFNQLMARGRASYYETIPEGGVIDQIQGKGNVIPKPEYQARLKDWFQTFPEADRPNWEEPGELQHPAQLNPDHPDAHEWRADDPTPDMGGYTPHGDYGLVPRVAPIDYKSMVEHLPHNDRTWDSADVSALYHAARQRRQIPDLAQAWHDWHQETVQPEFDDLRERNFDSMAPYPGESYDEDPTHWDELATLPEKGFDSPHYYDETGPEAFNTARENYEEGENELARLHVPTQISNELAEKLHPHFHPQGWAMTEEGPKSSGYYNPVYDPEMGQLGPDQIEPYLQGQPQQSPVGTFARVASEPPDLRALPYAPWDTALKEAVSNSNRFHFRHRESVPDWGNQHRHRYDVEPVGAPATHEGTWYDRVRRYGYDPELVTPERGEFGADFRWNGHPEWRREMYRGDDGSDQGFREEVQADPGLLYRGLSHEEWEDARERGYFQSNGEYNIGGEQGTLFSTDPDQARSYAAGFAPWHRKPGFQAPSYVIAVPRPGDAHPHPGMGPNTTEIVVPGQVPFDQMQRAWQIRPYAIRHGDMDVSTENFGQTWGGHPSMGNYQNAYRELPLGQRTAATSPVTSWHLTDDPQFALDPNRVPTDNALAISQRAEPGLYVGDPESWLHGHGYARPFVAEIEHPPTQAGRWNGESFIPAADFPQTRVKRVIPTDEYAREHYGSPGWYESEVAPPEQSKFPNYRYQGPDAREMTPEQVAHYRDLALRYREINHPEQFPAGEKCPTCLDDQTVGTQDPTKFYCESCGGRFPYTHGVTASAMPTWFHGTHADRAQAIQANGWDPNEDLWFSSSPQEAATYQERHGMGQPGAVLQAGLNYRNPFVVDRTTPEPHTTGFSPRLRQALQGAGVDPPDRHDWATELRNKGYDAIEYRKPNFTDVQLWDPALVSHLQPHAGVISSVIGPKLSTGALYKRWAFSPASGQVTITDNSGDPLDVKYHGDLARELNEPNLQHGFAYRIGNGWRLTDWEHAPLADNFVVAQVMRALANEPGTPHEGSWEPLGADDWSRPHHGLPT